MKQKEEQSSRAREESQIEEMVEAIAVKSQVLSLGTLDNAIEELKTPGEFQAKNLQALSVAAKNFVGLYREAKNLNAPAEKAGGGTTLVFMGDFVRATPEQAPRNVTPDTQSEGASSALIDVAPADAASVATPTS